MQQQGLLDLYISSNGGSTGVGGGGVDELNISGLNISGASSLHAPTAAVIVSTAAGTFYDDHHHPQQQQQLVAVQQQLLPPTVLLATAASPSASVTTFPSSSSATTPAAFPFSGGGGDFNDLGNHSVSSIPSHHLHHQHLQLHQPQVAAPSLLPYLSVMSEDKSRLLRIPSHLIEPTMGSTRYLSEPNKKAVNMNAFKFHLCTEHRKETGGCPYKGECFFIHSRHTLDDSLAAQVEESPVHVCLDIKSYAEAPYPTHKYDDEGKGSTAILVTDSMTNQTFQIDAGCCYVTKGSQSALQLALRQQQQQPAAAQPQRGNSGSAVPIKLPPQGAAGTHHQSQFPPAHQLSSPAAGGAVTPRHTLCTHYVRGWCARGAECLYLHRIKLCGRFIASKAPPSISSVETGGGDDEWLPQVSATSTVLPPPPPPPSAVSSAVHTNPEHQQVKFVHHQFHHQQQQQILLVSPQQAFPKHQHLPHQQHHQQQNVLVLQQQQQQAQTPYLMSPPALQQQQIFAINTPTGIQYVQIQQPPQQLELSSQQAPPPPPPPMMQNFALLPPPPPQQQQLASPHLMHNHHQQAYASRGQFATTGAFSQQQQQSQISNASVPAGSQQIFFHNGVAYVSGQ